MRTIRSVVLAEQDLWPLSRAARLTPLAIREQPPGWGQLSVEEKRAHLDGLPAGAVVAHPSDPRHRVLDRITSPSISGRCIVVVGYPDLLLARGVLAGIIEVASQHRDPAWWQTSPTSGPDGAARIDVLTVEAGRHHLLAAEALVVIDQALSLLASQDDPDFGQGQDG